MPKYKIHELATLFPSAGKATVKQMAENIKAHGQQEKAILLGGELLDGRTRQEACELAGVELQTEDYLEYLARTGQPADKNPREVVVSLNLHRRHLSDTQRIAIAAKLVRTVHGGDRSKSKGPNAPLTAEAAAKLTNTKKNSVKRAARIIKKGAEGLQVLVEDGVLPISVAALAAKLPKEVQEAAVKGGVEGVKAAVEKSKAKSKKSKTVPEFRARLVEAIETEAKSAGKDAHVDMTAKQAFNRAIKIVEDME